MKRHHQMAAGLLSGVSALALTSVAYAQAAAPGSQVEEVVVTGSRVIQNGNNSPVPVTVVTTAQLAQTNPSNIQDGLQQLPVFAGNQQGPQRTPGNANQNAAAHTLNLRNIGTTRTLVLFDGRRVAPTSPLGEVDADQVPSLLLQRVDIVTGGVSAVYGSDAVAGVVNFITDRNFNGYKFEAQVGRSERGDGDEQRLGIAGGMPIFGGRGHIEGSYEYYNSPGIFNRLSRDWGRNVWTVQGTGTAANPIKLVRNTRLNATSFLGYITAANPATNPLRDMVFRQNGVLDKFQHGGVTGSAGAESGGDGGFFWLSSLLSLYQSDQFFGRADFDVTDDVHAWAEFTGTRTHNMNNHESNEYRNITISATNAFLPPQYQAQLAAAKVSTFTFSKMMQQAGAKQPETHATNYMAQGGLEGKISDNWKWDVSFVTNKNTQHTRNNYATHNGRALSALDAVVNPANGQIVCNVTLTNPGLYPGCVPINLFGPTSESREAINYILGVTEFVAETKMNNIGGTIAGSPFSTWAGNVQVALSGEWRKLEYKLDSNAKPGQLDCTGIRFNNCKLGTQTWLTDVQAVRTPVSQTVKEVALEASVPLLKDKAFAQDLSLTGALRYTDYDTSGSVYTWKVGADWTVNDQISFRATRSRDIRAPNLAELFNPDRLTPAGVQDIHTGIVGQASSITSSNPNLEVEIAKSYTAGVVVRPTFIPRFSLAVDWYKISIGNAIVSVGGSGNATVQTICENSGGTSVFCELTPRPLPFSDHSPANFPIAFYAKPLNAQTSDTNGVDVEANWNTDLLGGQLNLRGLVAYQPHLTTVQFPGAPVLDAGGTANQAAWRVTAFARYEHGPYSIDVQERYRSSERWNADPNLMYAEPDLPAYYLTNVTLGYKLNDAQFFLTIKNLFDKQPDPYGQIGGASAVPGLFGGYPNSDDTIGRYYNIGVRIRH